MPQLSLVARRGAALLVLSAVIAGCGGAPPPAGAAAGPMHTEAAPADEPAPAPESPAQAPVAPADRIGSAPAPRGATAPAGAKAAPSDRAKAPDAMIIFTGELAMLVAPGQDAAAMESAVLVAEEVGGHLAGRGNDFVKVKVPSARFREVMTRLEKLGEVTQRSVSAADVTAEFKDLEVRLENLRATRKRIEEFMARAANMTELFQVERELERVTTEIDTIQGRLRFLREHAALSVITLRATPKPKPVIADGPKPPPPPSRPDPRAIDLPVSWLGTLGIDQLIRL